MTTQLQLVNIIITIIMWCSVAGCAVPDTSRDGSACICWVRHHSQYHNPQQFLSLDPQISHSVSTLGRTSADLQNSYTKLYWWCRKCIVIRNNINYSRLFNLERTESYRRESNVYWTVHHCNSWRMKDQLDVTCYFISLIMRSTCFGH